MASVKHVVGTSQPLENERKAGSAGIVKLPKESVMFGCCQVPQNKFINKDDTVDRERLSRLLKGMTEKGFTDDECLETCRCDCSCHQDGVVCLC